MQMAIGEPLAVSGQRPCSRSRSSTRTAVWLRPTTTIATMTSGRRSARSITSCALFIRTLAERRISLVLPHPSRAKQTTVVSQSVVGRAVAEPSAADGHLAP